MNQPSLMIPPLANALPPSSAQRRGQLFSLDIVISLLLFVAFFVFFLQVWTVYTARMQQQLITEELQVAAVQVTDLLLKFPGTPANWERDAPSLEVLGLQRAPGVLAPEKLTALTTLSYARTEQLLNIERFEFALAIVDSFGNEVYAKDSGQPPKQPQGAIAVNRYMLLNNQTVQFIFTLWTPT